LYVSTKSDFLSKKEMQFVNNIIELLFGYGHQEDKHYILQYKEGHRDLGILSQGIGYKEAINEYNRIINEENELALIIDNIFP
jgi:hypothetical protein